MSTAPTAPIALGVSLPVSSAGGPIEAGRIAALAARADELGFSAVSCGDHLLWHSAMVDPLVTLASLAPRTCRSSLMTGVLLAPLRHPLWLVKQLATLQLVSGGRTVLGVGVGGELPEEFAALGLDVHHRGRDTDAALRTLAAVWARDPGGAPGATDAAALVVEVEGRSLPIAPRTAPVPVWVGGRSAAAMARAVAHAAGWIGIFLTPGGLESAIAELAAITTAAGRPTPPRAGIQLFVCHDDDGARGRERAAAYAARHFGALSPGLRSHLIAGPEGELRDRIGPFLSTGAGFVQFHLSADGEERTLEAVASAVADLLPAPPLHTLATSSGTMGEEHRT